MSALSFVAGMPVAMAQSTPRAGSVSTEADRVLQSIRPQRPKPPAERPRVDLRRPAGESLGEVAPSERVQVQRFVVAGAQAVPTATLEELLAPLSGRALSFTELNGAAEIVSDYYRSRDLLATAFLPPQTIGADGVVRIEVRESTLGQLNIEREEGARLRERVAEGVLRRRLKDGEPLSLVAVEEGLLALNALRGVRASADVQTLEEGAAAPAAGTTGVRVRLAGSPLLSWQIGLSNFGSRTTGRALADARVDLNGALGLGEQFSLGLLSSGKELNFARLSANVPVHASGTALVAALSGLRLKAEDAALQPTSTASNGKSRSASLDITQPLLRRRDALWVMALGGEVRQLLDEPVADPGGSVLVVPTDRDLRLARLSLSGEWAADGGGIAAVGLELRSGKATLNNEADRLADAADGTGARVAGSYRKLSFTASRVQPWQPGWSVLVSLRGQAALNRSLDFSEKISVGGADAVRGYAAGEAPSDSAVIGTFEWRRAFVLRNIGWQASLFVDGAQLRRWYTAVPLGAGADGTPIPNHYKLASAGLGLAFAGGEPGLSGRLVAARPLGSNAARDAQGRESDGRSGNKWRYWIQLALSL
jgi:hemolysin activation/secretion protein